MAFELRNGMDLRECVSERGEGVVIRFHIQPRASTSEIVGLFGKAYKIRIAAPPVDGQANAELIRFLARLFGVARQGVQVLGGVNSRQKRVLIKGRTFKEIEPLLAPNRDPKNL